jgi:hypothetical protein
MTRRAVSLKCLPSMVDVFVHPELRRKFARGGHRGALSIAAETLEARPDAAGSSVITCADSVVR